MCWYDSSFSPARYSRGRIIFEGISAIPVVPARSGTIINFSPNCPLGFPHGSLRLVRVKIMKPFSSFFSVFSVFSSGTVSICRIVFLARECTVFYCYSITAAKYIVSFSSSAIPTICLKRVMLFLFL